jgi:pimeloyl-ACP methyl ester carboxylesterase
VRDFSDDLAALLDALDLDAVHVAGHSMGGGVALQLAIDHPPRVRSLVLVAPMSP